jgi:hypothetical protein
MLSRHELQNIIIGNEPSWKGEVIQAITSHLGREKRAIQANPESKQFRIEEEEILSRFAEINGLWPGTGCKQLAYSELIKMNPKPAEGTFISNKGHDFSPLNDTPQLFQPFRSLCIFVITKNEGYGKHGSISY